MRKAVIVVLVLLLGAAFSSGARAAQGLEQNLAYGPDPGQRLDLSVPAAKGFATVIFIHGGSLTGGDKADEDYGSVGTPFLGAGIACANVNYRLAPANVWPAQAEDVAAAVAWVQKNIASRGGDPRKLFLLGHSTGALLSVLVAADERFLAKQGLKAGDLRGVIAMGSIMWDDELEQALIRNGRPKVEEAFGKNPESRIFASLDAYRDQWPIRHVRAGMPPILFLIAEEEQIHPPVLMTDQKFVEGARALGNWAELKVLPGRKHYSAIRDLHKPDDFVFILVRDFIRQFGGGGR